MEKVEKERVVKYVVYTATDGTEFFEESECRKYENSAAGMLLGRLMEFSKPCENFEIDGSEENIYRIAVPTKQEHLNTLNQLHKMFRGVTDCPSLFTEKDLKYPIAVGYRTYEGALDWVWFYKLNDWIKRITDNSFEIEKR